MTAHDRTDDEATLHRLGYAQVLYRGMGGFSNFAISFTIISILGLVPALGAQLVHRAGS